MKKPRRIVIAAVFTALVLFGGSILLALWLVAPDREGSTSAEIDTKLHTQRMNQELDPEIAAKLRDARYNFSAYRNT